MKAIGSTLKGNFARLVLCLAVASMNFGLAFHVTELYMQYGLSRVDSHFYVPLVFLIMNGMIMTFGYFAAEEFDRGNL